MANVTTLKPPETPENTETEQTNSEAPAKKGRFGVRARGSGKPKGPVADFEGKQPRFFDKVNSIPAEDWGTRAFMYVYMDEPVCNAKTWGETRYLLKSSKPIRDLEGLKQDYGSFKGWMSLNLRKTGKDASEEADRLNFEIYDLKCPPKIPRTAWANDARNKRWLDLLPPEKPDGAAAAGTMLDAMRMYKEIRADVKEESGPMEPATRTNEVIETMLAAKELFAPATTAPAAPVDPFDTAKKIMEMRGNDPMIAMLMQRMDAQDKAAEKAREREYELQKELRQLQNGPTAQSKSLVDQFKELASIKEVLKDVFGAGEGVAAVAGRGRTNWMDLAREIVPQVINSELMAGIGAKIAASATAGATAPNPAMSPQQTSANSASDNTEAAFQRWIRDVVNKQVIRFFLHLPGMDGIDLADMLYAMEPEWTLRLQRFEHPQLPGLSGKEAILAAYKVTPSVWPQIQQSGRAQEFETFVEQFCQWKPTDVDEEDDGIIDLTATPAGSSGDEGEGEA